MLLVFLIKFNFQRTQDHNRPSTATNIRICQRTFFAYYFHVFQKNRKILKLDDFCNNLTSRYPLIGVHRAQNIDQAHMFHVRPISLRALND